MSKNAIGSNSKAASGAQMTARQRPIINTRKLPLHSRKSSMVTRDFDRRITRVKPIPSMDSEEKKKMVMNEEFNIDKTEDAEGDITREIFEQKLLMLDACQLGVPHLKIHKISPAGTSPALIIFADLHGYDVLVKLTFRSRNQNIDNSLHIERQIYRDLQPYLQNYTPHLVNFVAEYECSDFISSMQTLASEGPRQNPHATTILRLIEYLDNDPLRDRALYDWGHAYFLMTEVAGGKSLNEWIRSPTYQRQFDREQRLFFLLSVLLQLAYTLTVFETIGFMHNDLHFENVLVEELSEPREWKYALPLPEGMSTDDEKHESYGEHIFRWECQYHVRIIDFDRSSKISNPIHPGVYYNTRLPKSECPSYGQCNAFTPSRDWFNILHSMYHIRDTTVMSLVEEIVPRNLLSLPIASDIPNSRSLRGALAWVGQACVCQVQNCDYCTNIRTHYSGIKSPRYFIREYFPRYHNHHASGIYRLPGMLVPKLPTHQEQPRSLWQSLYSTLGWK